MKKDKLTLDSFRKMAMKQFLNAILNWILILTLPIWGFAFAWFIIAKDATARSGYERDIVLGRKSLLS